MAVILSVAPVASAQSVEEPRDRVAEPPSFSNVRNEWRPGDPLPAGYHAEKEPYVPLVMAGSIQLGTSWLTLGVLPAAILIVGGIDSQTDTNPCQSCVATGATLFVPALGPFAAMATLGAYGESEPAAYALLAVDGLIQGVGLGMLIAGLAMQHDVLVRDRGGRADVELTPVVAAGPDGGKLGLSGSF
ncbi:MAG: hypothetical protein U0271_44005 [Polyangiaceae bacterium]